MGLLRSISEAAGVPIVFHGGTSIPEATIREGIERCGVAKVNIDTAIRQSFAETWHKLYTDSEFAPKVSRHDPRQVVALARDQAIEAIRAKMQLFGSSGKAAE